MPSIEERFHNLAGAVPIPSPWDLDSYLTAVASYRHRPITLRPTDTTALAGTGCGTGSGLWIARRDDDIIVYDRATSRWHAQHIILHEIGHMLLEHDQQPVTETAVPASTVQMLLPSVSPEAVRLVLGRNAYDSDRERDAERFADLTMMHTNTPQQSSSPLRGTIFRDWRR
ncbi:hypothetical protein ACWEO2_26240 [Nocardia sp. NPDC004278]